MLRQLIARHIVWVDALNHNTLRLGEEARALLRGETTVNVRKRTAQKRRKKANRAASDPTLQDLTKEDLGLYEELRQWRSQRAKDLGKPPFVIFKDVTLIEIARSRPTDEDGLRQISGVGEKKLLNYGSDVIEMVKAHA